MTNLEKWNCPNCSQHNSLSKSFISYENDLGKCTGCGTKAVRHSCSNDSIFSQNNMWLPILLSGVSLACPTCNTTYRVAEKIHNSPNAPEWVKVGAKLIGGIALGVGIVKLGEAIEETIN